VEERNYGNGESIGRRDNEDRNRMEYSRGGRENVDDLDERNKYAPSPSIHMRDGRHVESHSQMPPRIPAISNRRQADIPQNTFQHSARGVQPAQSDLSSMTGAVNVTFPTPTSARGISTRSVASMASVSSAWHNDDVVLLPKGQKLSEVAVAATAAASLILEDQSVCGFDTAARSVSNLVQPGNHTNNIGAVIEPSVLGQVQEEHSHVPVSYASVQEGMKRDLMMTASVTNAKQERMGSLPMDAYQFWARCTLLVATSILKTGHGNTQLAHAAAETVMMHGIATMHQEWLNTADHDLKTVADAVNDTVTNAPGGNEDIASAASIALLTDGTKALAMERVRRSVPSPYDSSPVMEELSESESRNFTDRDAVFDNKSTSWPDNIDHHNYQNRSVEEKSRAVGIPPLSSAPSGDVAWTRGSGIEINRIRSTGSLLDAGCSEDEQEEAKVATTPIVPESYEAYKKDYLANTVNKLLSTPTEDKPAPPIQMPTSTSPKLRYQELEQRREEIAQRIQRIQRRATAERDMPVALDHINVSKIPKTSTKGSSLNSNGVGEGTRGTSSVAGGSMRGPPSIASSNTKLPPGGKGMRGPPSISTATLGKKLPPARPVRISGKKKPTAESGDNIFNPVIQFIEKFACSMDMGESESDDSEEHDDVNENKNKNKNKLFHPTSGPEEVEKAFKEEVDGMDDWKAFRLNETSKLNLNTIDNVNSEEENWETLESLDLPENIEDRRSGAGNESNSILSPLLDRNSGIQLSTKSQDSGAFSAAFNEGRLSEIPMKRLSLTTSSPLTSTLDLETNQHLFFSGETPTQPSASDAYMMNTTGRDRDARSRAPDSQSASPPISFPNISTENKKKVPFRNRFSRR